jgi:ParB family transcriptional regulator, chromosome partitioning protein
MKNQNKGLGRGLDALIKPDFYEESSMDTSICNISINKIEASSAQPRTMFDEEKIQELSLSIKKQGVLQPILVRKNSQGKYQIIAGERRWRASMIAGLKNIPAIVRDYTDSEALAIALIENIQREDLNIMEQAKALERLKNELGINQEELAEYIGKSRSHLANTLRLINLPEKIKENISGNQLTAGHARSLLALKNHETMLVAAREIIKKSLSVREAENLIKKLSQPEKSHKRKKKTDEGLAEKMQQIMQEKVNRGLKVKLTGTAQKGQLTINYSNEEQLKDFLKILE